MKLGSLAAALGAMGLLLGGASVLPVAGPSPRVTPAIAQVPVTPEAKPTLTKQDVDAWLDGMMPTALASGDIAGAVVVVVKDGQVLTEKGYGYADVAARRPVDPKRTLFRPGSTSKLFTWTAVMQQVEAGKLNLDTDVNTYLDFKVPPLGGKPITLRNLMTHTPGFEEGAKHDFVGSPDRLLPLGKFLVCCMPKRVFPPGEVPSYSNYGATLAGYIVQRVSGEPFNEYIERHILTPLGMTHSTFAQPLPAALMADMAKGYLRASQPPKPYELVTIAPAGSMSATGDDMSRFMIAQLQDGQYGSVRILQAATARQMHTQQHQFNPPLPAMALGFYHEDRNGQQIVGHAGDTETFHSDLHLLLNDNVGLFISLNSLGKEGAAGPLREAFFRGFLDRYFPAPPSHLATTTTAKADARTMQGLYWFSRRSQTSFLAALNLLGETKVIADPDGTMKVSTLVDASRAPKVWREVGPFRWTDDRGSTLAAVVKDGKVVNFTSDDLPPVLQFQPVPGWAQASWSLPLLGAAVGVLLLTLLLWPLQVLVRRRYGQRFELVGRRAMLYRLTRLAAFVQLAGLGAYLAFVALLTGGLANADSPTDPVLILAQGLCVLGVLGVAVMAWNAVAVWTSPGRSWWARLSSALILLAGAAFAWFVFTLHLATFSLAY
jgi:CubicO group peptidase (beta-lactamase class C family)